MTKQTFAAWEAELKAKMHESKKTTGNKIGHCYEIYAKQQGYNNYAALRAAKKVKLA